MRPSRESRASAVWRARPGLGRGMRNQERDRKFIFYLGAPSTSSGQALGNRRQGAGATLACGSNLSLRCRALRLWNWRRFLSVRLFPRDQLIQVVAERPIRAELLFIKQALDTATQAHLVGMVLHAHRPAHAAMPAASHHQKSQSGQARGRHSNWPQPTWHFAFPLLRVFLIRCFGHPISLGYFSRVGRISAHGKL